MQKSQLKTKRSFSIFRLAIPIMFGSSCVFGGSIMFNELIKSGWFDLILAVGSLGFLSFGISLLIMVFQFCVENIHYKMEFYPNINRIRLCNSKNQLFDIHFSDIKSSEIHKMDIYFAFGGYAKLELKNGEIFYLSSGIINLPEWHNYLRIGSDNKKIYRSIVAFLPFRR